MTGVSIEQWRGSIGHFHKRSILKKILTNYSDSDFLITSTILRYLHLMNPFLSFFYNLALLFSYCVLMVTIFPITFLSYILIGFLLPCYCYYSSLNLISLSLHVFWLINSIPTAVSNLKRPLQFFIAKPKLKNSTFFIIVLQILLVISGIEINPGPPTSKKNLSFAVWNLDSIPARNYARIPLIETFQATYNFDLFGVCESSLNENILNETIFIDGFSPDPFRADKPDDSRNGGVCLYFKENLPITERKDLVTLPETIVAEIKLNRKKIFIVLSYRHPNISSTEFDEYVKSLEKIYEKISLENPTVTIVCGDFNARSPLFWENDTNTREGNIFNNFLISNNLEELINEPTHIRDDGSQSCIDLICTDQPFMFVDSGVLPSLDPHSKHSIIHGTLNFHAPSPPPYKRRVWDFKTAKVEQIRDELSNMDWHSLFSRLNVNEMTLVFSNTLLDIFSRNISNRIITCNDKDAAWITPQVKKAIKRNSRVYRKWVKRGRKPEDHDKVREVQNSTNKMIRETKSSYYEKLGDTISDPRTGQKHFWTAFKRITNKKKTTNIPPIIDNKLFVSNFQQKAKIFNDYFADQCTIHDNGSVLPAFNLRTNAILSQIDINEDQIVDIISKQNSKKAHGCDNISVAMLQLCPTEISVPLSLIFQKCVTIGKFPDSWKFANVQPIHKKNNRQIKSNYRPISLLPICGKILEKIIFDQVYSFLNDNRLISTNQSGFRPGDSTIYQLISITSNIYKTFEKHDETRALFLDISKAFDKVWHDGLIFKLKSSGISGTLLSFFENYLQNRHQRVVLNGAMSDWSSISAGVPQGSVLGPLLFLVYINDLTENISSQMRLFADDSSLFTPVKVIIETNEKLTQDLQTITNWAYQWKMVFNPDITKQAVEVIFSVKKKKPYHPELNFNDVPVSREEHTKHLGVFLDSKLNFSKHIHEAVRKATKGLSLMKYLSRYVSRKVLDLSYKLYVRPHLDYGDVIYHNQRTDLMDLIEQIQYKAALVVTGCWQGTSRVKLYDELGWESLADRRWGRRMTLYYKILNGLTPSYLFEHIPDNTPNVTLRKFTQKTDRYDTTDRYDNSFFPFCIDNWNNLDSCIRLSSSLSNFKTNINNFIRPKSTSFYSIRDKEGIKLLTKIRVTFSDLRDHRFNHNFNCVNPTCRCGLEDETSVHYFLCCPRYNNLRTVYLSRISEIVKSDITILPKDHLAHLLTYGSNVYNDITNELILTETIQFIKKSKRFKNLEAFA